MSITEQIYDTLLTDLISLKIPPGTRIAVDALVRRFAVSQTPIRAALIKLEAEGLVVRTRNVGYSAAPMRSEEHTSELQSRGHLLYIQSLPTRRSSDLVYHRTNIRYAIN